VTGVRVRRPPPPLERVSVVAVQHRTPRLVRVVLSGPGLASWPEIQPGASLRLLLPRPGSTRLDLPAWTGNEYLYDDGTRPPIRTLTPLPVEPTASPDGPALAVEVVRHGSGSLSDWAETVGSGDAVAVSGPGRGYAPDPAATSFLVAGDESALPAITTLLPALPDGADATVLVEIADPVARLAWSGRPGEVTTWLDLPAGAPPGDRLVEAVVATELDPAVRVWAAGEAAAMQRIRRHLLEVRGLPRSQAVVRGYWKHGRGGDLDADPD
jgi:NADPH-dependent ferric siderophore reductase